MHTVSALISNCEGFLCDGLIRVDIMCTNDGRLIVNEIESLEASYNSKNFNNNLQLTNKLVQYWINQISELISLYDSVGNNNDRDDNDKPENDDFYNDDAPHVQDSHSESNGGCKATSTKKGKRRRNE